MFKGKNLIILIVLVVLVGSASFYGGMKYTTSKNSSSLAARGQNFRAGATGGNFAGTRGGANGGGGFTNGDIIAKDNQSLTLKLQNGGSKIVFFTASTTVEKFVTTVPTDLVVGQTVMVSGASNSDGSLSATSIQLRPAGFGSSTALKK